MDGMIEVCLLLLEGWAFIEKLRRSLLHNEGKQRGQLLQACHGPWHLPGVDHGLCWHWIFALSLLHRRTNSWMTMKEVKTRPLKD